MARAKFHTLTEQMVYILLVLQDECYGVDIMERVAAMTQGRVPIGAGTLYTLLDSFVESNFIRQTRVEGRKRCYQITEIGREALEKERLRMSTVLDDFTIFWRGEDSV